MPILLPSDGRKFRQKKCLVIPVGFGGKRRLEWEKEKEKAKEKEKQSELVLRG